MSEQVNNLDSSAGEVVSFSGTPVGEQLRLAREARGLELGDMAQALKLGLRQVEALESGNWNLLPGNTFIRGFVRNYARLMQLDPTPLMAQLDQVLAKPASSLAVADAPAAEMPSSSTAVAQRSKALVLLSALFVALAASAYFLMAADLSTLRESTQSLLDSLARKETNTVEPAAAPVAPAAEPVFPPGATPQQIMNPQAMAPAEVPAVQSVPAPVAGPEVKANVDAKANVPAEIVNAPQMRFLFEKDSWLEVRDRDNKVVFAQKLAAGTEQTLSGQGPLTIKIGYAPGVKLFWHGEAVDLVPHTRGDVARLVLE